MKTRKKHFEVFEQAVRYWLNKFGLHSWDVTIKHSVDEQDGTKYVAWTEFSGFDSRSCNVCLNKVWEDAKPTDEELRRVAFHEVCHILLHDLSSLAEARFGVTREIIDKETHFVIGTLETVLWRNDMICSACGQHNTCSDCDVCQRCLTPFDDNDKDDSDKSEGDQNAQRDHHSGNAR